MTHSHSLRGELTVPADKSISHRALMFGSIASGNTIIRHFLNGADCLSTADAFRRLGIEIGFDEKNEEAIVHGKGLHGLHPAPGEDVAKLFCGNSGTTMRLMAGILAGQHFSSYVYGDDSLNSRPMKRIMLPLSMMGAQINSEKENDCAPLLIRGGSLRGIRFLSPVASAQVKSAVLLAGLYADRETRVIEPSVSRDHTERFLKAFGADVFAKDISEDDGESYFAGVYPCEELTAQDVYVPGDISSAAYFLVAASLLPGSALCLKQVGINPTRSGILSVLGDMGSEITVENVSLFLEPYADLIIKEAPLKGTVIEGSLIPLLIDELPILCIAALFAEGETIIKDASELRVKESDRLSVLYENMTAMGAKVTETEDGLIIEGGHPLHGAPIKTHGDHRIAMSFAIAERIGQARFGEDFSLPLDNTECVNISYPGFFSDLEALS